LAESIKANGVLQPILVRPTGDGEFELVAGERRLRASKAAGLTTIPAIVRKLSDRESLEIAMVENLQREDLGPLERAVAYDRYMTAFVATADQLALKLSESRANIANYMRLLKLHPDIQGLLKDRSLGMGQARAIAGIAQPQRQLAVARMAVSRNLSVRQVEQLAARPSGDVADHEPATERLAADKHLRDIERRMTRTIGLKVSVKSGRRKNSGRIVLHYADLDEFDRLAERLGVDLQLDG
jgi:ParB family chromosome partitioning protein